MRIAVGILKYGLVLMINTASASKDDDVCEIVIFRAIALFC